MAARNRMGPAEKGPNTGRKLGPCKGADSDAIRPILIRGRGRGLGLGRGGARGRMRKIRFGFAE